MGLYYFLMLIIGIIMVVLGYKKSESNTSKITLIVIGLILIILSIYLLR
jgi:uncharacterized protein (DUF983 family)